MNIHVLMIYLLAVWFVLQGISSIYMSVRSRFFNSGWVLGLIVGIISIFLGIYTALHPTVGVLTIGILVGIYLIEAGIDLIIVGAMIGRIEAVAKGARAFVDEAKSAINEAYQAESNPAESADTENKEE